MVAAWARTWLSMSGLRATYAQLTPDLRGFSPTKDDSSTMSQDTILKSDFTPTRNHKKTMVCRHIISCKKSTYATTYVICISNVFHKWRGCKVPKARVNLGTPPEARSTSLSNKALGKRLPGLGGIMVWWGSGKGSNNNNNNNNNNNQTEKGTQRRSARRQPRKRSRRRQSGPGTVPHDVTQWGLLEYGGQCVVKKKLDKQNVFLTQKGGWYY